jgi:hypothetical protein
LCFVYVTCITSCYIPALRFLYMHHLCALCFVYVTCITIRALGLIGIEMERNISFCAHYMSFPWMHACTTMQSLSFFVP